MTRSLRGRLLLGLLAVVVAGLLVSDVATYAALQSFLVKRVDDQLLSGRFLVFGDVMRPQPHGGHDRPPAPSDFPAGTYYTLRTPAGETIAEQTLTPPWLDQSASSARPRLPARLPSGGRDNPAMVTYPGTGGVSQYRVLIQTVDNGPAAGDLVVLAIPLTAVQSTLDLLLVIEASITAAVLLIIALFAWWVIAIGLRPLERMGRTAEQIAAGDLSRRVEPATPRTEIGRLGLALNGMLSQIERAFAERTQSEQRLRRFLADASHELRTPLTSIRGYAELLRRGAAQPARDAALARRRIEEEAVRMSVLVDDLLLLARLDQGRPLQRLPVDLQAVVRDACADVRTVAPKRAITLSAADPVVVMGDERRLRQVVGNLLSNAIVHTPPDSPVEVRLRRDGRRARLEVSDHGPGVAGEEARRIFEPFYRVDPGRSRDDGGSGLGLSIVAAVVAAHGGEVEVAETPGGGASFRVDLPLAEAESGPPPAEAAAPPAAAPAAGSQPASTPTGQAGHAPSSERAPPASSPPSSSSAPGRSRQA